MCYADVEVVEVARAGNEGLVLDGAQGDEGWKPCREGNSTSQCTAKSGAQHQGPRRHPPYSEDSQETVTERREDVDAGRTKGLVEGDEVDQNSTAGACNDESIITSVPSDARLLADETKEQEKTGNISTRLFVSVSDQTGVPNLPISSIKPGLQTLPAGEPATPEQATEVVGLGDGPVGGSDASERPDFDLNEGILPDEASLDDGTTTPASRISLALVPHSVVTNLATPIAVVATMKGAFIPPASPLRLKGELGWKGSAATSAFRPAEPRRTPDRQQSATDGVAADPPPEISLKRMRPPLDIDLNVVDEGGLEAEGVLPQLPCLEQRVVNLVLEDMSYAHRTPPVKLDLDLNRVDEGEESGYLMVAEDKGCQFLHPSFRSELSASRSSVRDFDLNDGPASDDYFSVEDVALFTGSPKLAVPPAASVIGGLTLGGDGVNASEWFGPSNTSGAGVPSFPCTRADSCFTVALSGPQSSAGPGPTAFGYEYQAARGVIGSTASLYPSSSPAAGYSIAGYPPGSSFSYGCAMGFPSSSPPYVESAGSTSLTSSLSSQAGISGGAYVRPPYLLGVGDIPVQDGPSSWARANLDLNAGPDTTEREDVREDHTNVRQPIFSNKQNMKDDQSKGFRFGTVKRKEPEGGRGDLVRTGYGQSAWNV